MLITGKVGDKKKGAVNHLKDVVTIQSLLTSLSILTEKAGFDPKGVGQPIPDAPKSSGTIDAILAFQATFMNKPDGVISPGKTTYRKLLAALQTAQFPAKPAFVSVHGNTAKANKFGKFGWETIKDKTKGRVLKGSPVRLTDNWAKKNITSIIVPNLNTIPIPWNGKYTKTMQFNKSCTRQLVALWEAWGKANLISRIISYGGAYTARLTRTSTDKLSSHAWGTAFDINILQNKQGHIPSQLGDHGCVRELVGIANAHGFYWGGHFSNSDGMHFEVAVIQPAPVLTPKLVLPTGFMLAHSEVKLNPQG